MNPEELDEQFKGLEEDKQVQAAMAGKRPVAAKKKRITVAELNKIIDELADLIDKDIFSWLDKLDTRVRHFENAEAEKPDVPLQEISARLDALESVGVENLPSFVPDINARMAAIENATSALADIARSIIDDVERLQPAKAEEIEFAKPPVAIHDQPVQTADIAAVASVCLTMNDVLTITRALKDLPQLSGLERVEILNIACRSAGVEPTHGIQIRAGIHDTR